MSTLPTTDRGRATRERILETASELFYRQGVTATGLDQVIIASRTGKGQLYHYFADKRELVHAVIDRQITAVLEAQERVLANGDVGAWADELIAAYEQGDHPPQFGVALDVLVQDAAGLDLRLGGHGRADRWRGGGQCPLEFGS